MALFARLIPLLVLVVILFASSAAPLHAQDELRVIEPTDISVFIENGEGTTDDAIFISNEGDAVTGTLRVSTFLKASSPADFASSPICIIVNGSQCVNSFQTEFTFAEGSVTTIPITINVVNAANSRLAYGEATLMVLFGQDTTPDDGTLVTDPLTLADYRKLFFVPSLYVQDVLETALIFSVIIMALAVAYFFYRERPRLYNGLRHPLGEMIWGAQSWTAFLTALVSTISVVSLSGNSAGISVSAFSTNVYSPTLTILGILFSALPVLGVFLYRLLGRWSNNDDPQGGNLLGYIVGSACLVFALMGSVLISANVIQMLVLSTLGITDPPMIPVYLLFVTIASGVVIILTGIYFCSTFRSAIASQLRAQQAKQDKAATEDMLLDVVQRAWGNDNLQTIAALLALEALPNYDLGILTPEPDNTVFRGINEGNQSKRAQQQNMPKPETRDIPKIRL
jgi:hypothetical protein